MTWFELLTQSGIWDIRLPIPVALASVAVIGYLLGHRGRQKQAGEVAAQARKEIEATHQVAHELEWITDRVRKSLAKHHTSLARFKSRFRQLGQKGADQEWQDLCSEAEEILGPTLQLAGDIADAYDRIRQQSHQLMAFAKVRGDPSTGIGDGRALDEVLGSMFAIKHQYGLQFSVAIIGLGRFQGDHNGQPGAHDERGRRSLARLIENNLRNTDILARNSDGKLVIVMPGTDLPGAWTMAERLRQAAKERLSLSVSGGVATALESETAETLLRRADEAHRQAGEADHDAIWQHDGIQVGAHRQSPLPQETAGVS